MSASAVYELIGYLGSALIVISLSRKSLLKFRLWGLAGSIVFLVYSMLIEAYPIAVVNVVIIVIHLWFIRNLLSKTKEFFTVLKVRSDSRYLLFFLDFYRSEIDRFQPEFSYDPDAVDITVFILRDAVPAGLFIGKVHSDSTVEVKLDFVTPLYRDFKAGEFLSSTRSGVFENTMCDTAWTISGTAEHVQYLERMGFEPTALPDGNPIYSKDISALHEPPPPAGSVPFIVSDA